MSALVQLDSLFEISTPVEMWMSALMASTNVVTPLVQVARIQMVRTLACVKMVTKQTAQDSHA